MAFCFKTTFQSIFRLYDSDLVISLKSRSGSAVLVESVPRIRRSVLISGKMLAVHSFTVDKVVLNGFRSCSVTHVHPILVP